MNVSKFVDFTCKHFKVSSTLDFEEKVWSEIFSQLCTKIVWWGCSCDGAQTFDYNIAPRMLMLIIKAPR